MKLLEGKVALVTGGSRGIGEAIVRRFVAQGATVAFTFQSSEARAQQLVDELKAQGGIVQAWKSDAASYAGAEALVDDVVKTFGKLDILVNNAGITRDKLLMRMGEEDWDTVMETNLKSVFNLTKHSIRHMMRARTGSIINMTSIVGITGNAGQANYAASKAGIIGFTKSVAQEYGSKNVRCNAIAPGFIETEMTETLTPEVRAKYLENIPMNRMGNGEEVADVCVFLGSGLSSYVNGQTISVCGALNT
jgi:3-oxoacyl-[acyl-carrier protein] reductase